MTDFVRTFVLVARTHALRMVRARRMLLMLALAAVPAVPCFAISRFRSGAPPADIVTHGAWFLLLQIVTPLVALISGSSAASEEIADRTITYVFTRPVSRSGFFLGRWLASLLPAAIAITVSLLLMVAAVRHPQPELTGISSPLTTLILGCALLGGAVYSAIAAALGAWVRHPMIVGLAYVFALEGLIANLPGSSQDLSIQFYLRSILLTDGGSAWAWTAEDSLVVPDPSGVAIRTLLWILGGSLLAGCWFISRRQDT